MEFSDEQLKQWVYDHEYNWNGPTGGSKSDWDAWCAAPNPSDTFPKYYQDDYNETIAGLCREILSLRADNKDLLGMYQVCSEYREQYDGEVKKLLAAEVDRLLEGDEDGS